MDKKITEHHKYIEKQIAALTKQQKPDRNDIEALAQYHDRVTKNFQHERAIHLAVTFFFAGLMFAAWALSIILWLKFGFVPEIWPMYAIALVLTALEGFYIRHYYRLENRTQKLYDLTDEIYKLF
ncbi:hypothetical protein FWG95_01270 [Candidatus Saccharibacteria bacterium]|nr:hypothetical protein [Candidatus Saccharibacteria bacterium]